MAKRRTKSEKVHAKRSAIAISESGSFTLFAQDSAKSVDSKSVGSTKNDELFRSLLLSTPKQIGGDLLRTFLACCVLAVALVGVWFMLSQ